MRSQSGLAPRGLYLEAVALQQQRLPDAEYAQLLAEGALLTEQQVFSQVLHGRH